MNVRKCLKFITRRLRRRKESWRDSRVCGQTAYCGVEKPSAIKCTMNARRCLKFITRRLRKRKGSWRDSNGQGLSVYCDVGKSCSGEAHTIVQTPKPTVPPALATPQPDALPCPPLTQFSQSKNAPPAHCHAFILWLGRRDVCLLPVRYSFDDADRYAWGKALRRLSIRLQSHGKPGAVSRLASPGRISAVRAGGKGFFRSACSGAFLLRQTPGHHQRLLRLPANHMHQPPYRFHAQLLLGMIQR